MLPVMCDCETWYLILRELHRLKVFGNSVLWIVFEPKGEAVT
jgi:hypothetical protein